MAHQPRSGGGGIRAAALPVTPDLLPRRKNLRTALIEGKEEKRVGRWGWKESRRKMKKARGG